ncbi:MAG: hypothetical protein AABX38_03460 [Candidatus Micrarchaeota archaeon]
MSARLGIHLPRYDPKNNRIKGLCFRLIDKEHIEDLMDDAKKLIGHPKTSPATRVMIRAFIESSLVNAIKKSRETLNGFSIEANFPVEHIFKGYNLVTLAHNTPSRRSNLEAKAKYLEQISRIEEEYPVPEIKGLVRSCEGYAVEQITHMNEALATQISARFTRIFYDYPTDISPEAVMKMPNDHIVLVARKIGSDKIAAVFMADKEIVNLNRKTGELRVGERANDEEEVAFLDFVNVDADRQIVLDIIPFMAYKAVYIARNTYGPNLVVFAEARADSSILQACCRLAGMKWAGTLEQSSIFGTSEVDESGAFFRDTQAWYLPSEYYSETFRKPTHYEALGGTYEERNATREAIIARK